MYVCKHKHTRVHAHIKTISVAFRNKLVHICTHRDTCIQEYIVHICTDRDIYKQDIDTHTHAHKNLMLSFSNAYVRAYIHAYACIQTFARACTHHLCRAVQVKTFICI